MEDVPYGRILREGWLIMVIAALLGGVAAYGIAKLLPETYSANSTLLLQVESSEASLFERNQFSLARVKTYPALIDSPEVVDGVRADLGLKAEAYSDRDIRRMLAAENATDTVLLTVRADAPTASLAAGMANSAARHLSDLIEETENPAGDDRYDVSLDQMIPAVEPVSPSSPQVLAITGLGVIAGFAVGAILAVYRTTTNRRLRTISDVRQAAGLSVVGRVPRRPRLSKTPLRGRSEVAEEAAYADAVDNLFALGGTVVSRFVLIPVSSSSVDGSVLDGFLTAFAAAGRRVCTLDLRSDAERAANARSLSELLTDDTAPGASPGPSPSPGASDVYAMPADISMPTLEREIPSLVDRLGRDFDVVLVVAPVTSSVLIETTARTGAGVVLAVHHNSTSATDLAAVATRLRVMNVRPLGVLMTHVGMRDSGVAAESWRETDRVEITPSDGPAPGGAHDDTAPAAPVGGPIGASVDGGNIRHIGTGAFEPTDVAPEPAVVVDPEDEAGGASAAPVSSHGGGKGRARP